MSGLLVKSTIIMRENLEELNTRGLADVPVLLGGAALTRNYVERDLREVYEGRVFYGKDAFEGLRTMDTLMDGKRAGDLDPAFGREAGGRKLPPRKSQLDAAAPPVEIPARSDVATDVHDLHAAVRRRHASPRASRSTTSPAYINETALFRNQWQFRPEKGGDENDDEFKARIRPTLREQLANAQAGVAARARGRVGLLPGERRGQRPRRVEGRHAHAGAAALLVPAPAQGAVPLHRRLLPAGRVGRARLRRVPRRDDGPAGERSASRSCSPPTGTRSTCCCTACRSR